MRDTPFIKMHGLGNDFLVIDARAVHLAAHLETKEVLSAAQIARYNALRGYRADRYCAARSLDEKPRRLASHALGPAGQRWYIRHQDCDGLHRSGKR